MCTQTLLSESMVVKICYMYFYIMQWIGFVLCTSQVQDATTNGTRDHLAVGSHQLQREICHFSTSYHQLPSSLLSPKTSLNFAFVLISTPAKRCDYYRGDIICPQTNEHLTKYNPQPLVWWFLPPLQDILPWGWRQTHKVKIIYSITE